MRIQKLFAVLIVLVSALAAAQTRPKLTLDDFFNSVSFPSVEISPDGNSVVIAAERADWDQQIFRTDLWLYRDDTKSLIQLTQSGHDSEPKWSPDGRWIAFFSERKTSSGKSEEADDEEKKDEGTSQIYLISPNGGEAFPITQGEEDVHAFCWSPNSQTIYFATRQPWTKAQKEDYKKEWKDVLQYRTAERGDTIFTLDLSAALARHAAQPAKADASKKEDDTESDLTPGAVAISKSPLRIDHLETSPDGKELAFLSDAINQRQEKYEDIEIYTVDLTSVARALPLTSSGQALPATAASGKESMVETKLAEPNRITTNQAVEVRPHWANDSRHIFFSVEVGDPLGPYRDLQPHLYWVDTISKKVEQWNADFPGPIEHYTVAADAILASAATV